MARSALLLAAAAVCAATATPAVAAAPEGPASGICVVKNVPNVQPTTIKAGVTIAEASSAAADKKASCGVVSGVVKSLARAGAERPMTVSGYACTPTVRNNARVSWRCTWNGGSPRTTVTLMFAWRYTS